MSFATSLYFIALIPHTQLQQKITAVKHNFSQNYESRKALKVMPHITLQNPFKRMESFEAEFHLRLQDFFSGFNAFNIQLLNYDCFDKNKNKVIFINVVKNELLNQLHKKLIYFLREELKFTGAESSYMFHPHITVAYRDLIPEQFEKAWMIYKDKPFEDSFFANDVCLLKHDYRQWNVLSKFNLAT